MDSIRYQIQNVISTADLQQHIDATRFNNHSWGRLNKFFIMCMGWGSPKYASFLPQVTNPFPVK
jgi:hypothetical protein